MRVKRIILMVSLAIGLLSPIAIGIGQVSAAEVFNNCGSDSASGSPDVCKDANNQQADNGNNNPIIGIIKSAIQVISYLIGAAAIIGIVVSGIRFMTAGGNAEAVASARSGLLYSLVGIAVAVLAQAMVAYVLDKVK